MFRVQRFRADAETKAKGKRIKAKGE